MSDKDYSLTKELTSETIEAWSNRSYISKELQKKLARADALIVPNEGYDDDADLRYFPEGTEDLVSFLQRNIKEDQYVDVCIEEGDYKELAQHADLLIIAGAVVTTIFAPLFVNLVTEYIKHRVGKRADDTTVKTSLTISDRRNGKSITLTYDGPASTYEKIMLGAVNESVKELEGESPPALKRISAAPKVQAKNEGK